MGKPAGKCRHFELLAAAVAAGSSVRDAAETVGISERAAYGASGSPDFRLRVSQLRAAAIDAAIGEITSATVLAVRRLVALLDDPHAGVQAAKAILSHVAPLSELGELRRRLDDLEARSK